MISTQLGSVLRRYEEPVLVKADKSYRQLTVRLHGKGVVLRGEVNGSQIASERAFAVREGQFILSRIDARNGAFGLVPASLDGAVVSRDFPSFDVDESRVLPSFLEWMSKTREFVSICQLASEGTTNRVRLQEAKFLEAEIPLPPLAEQQRIVARIEALAGKIAAARRLREEATTETHLLLENLIDTAFEEIHHPAYPLRHLTTKIGSGSTPRGGKEVYAESGVPLIRSLNVRMRTFQWDGIAFISDDVHQQMAGTQVEPNDVLLNITGASIGRVSCAPNVPTANVTQHVMIIRPTQTLNNRYLMYWLSRPSMQNSINEQQKGATRQAITKSQVAQFEIPLPPIDEQIKIVNQLDNYQSQIQLVQLEQTQTNQELDALLPAILDRAFKGAL